FADHFTLASVALAERRHLVGHEEDDVGQAGGRRLGKSGCAERGESSEISAGHRPPAYSLMVQEDDVGLPAPRSTGFQACVVFVFSDTQSKTNTNDRRVGHPW